MSNNGKNDIDSLLESMFRGGRLNFKKKEPGQAGSPAARTGSRPPELLWDPAGDSAKAGKALDAVDKAGKAFSQSVEKSIEQLTEETQADLKELEQRLKQDGVEASSAGNNGNGKDLAAAFSKARQEAGEQVLGQEEFLSALTLAFQRPFVAGSEKEAPLCRAAVLGKPGTGRHSALKALAESLGRQGVLKSPKLAFLDLGRYGEAGSERLFLQDLYSALKSGACGVVFERFEACHPSVLATVSTLFQEGKAPLPGRYVEQKGMLVETGTALVPGAVSELSGAGKYLFLLTDRKETELADAFGAPFLSSLEDLCETRPFREEDLEAIAARALDGLCRLAKEKLGFSLTYDKEAVKALVDAYGPETGAAAFGEETEKLYQALGGAKLRQGLEGASGTVFREGGGLSVRLEKAGETVTLHGGGDSGAAARASAVEEVKRELREIVGLREVKEYILSLEDHFQMQQLRKKKGMKAESPSMHMIFTGNPGTGKTTVARIVSRYLKAIGVLSGGQLVEVTRADLVGQYVGHTAPLTQKAIRSALGGVLFIDEAYSLFRGRDDSFGLEAIDTLVKGMEDHRDSLVVILAGYSREMEEFLTANSGLRSRFPNIIEFPDYTAAELMEITRSIVKGKGYRLDPACDGPLTAYYEKQQREGDPRTNGNGRMARNKVEEAILSCSRRNMRLPEEQRDLELLLPEDFGVASSGNGETKL